jgi:hypothetical protein
MRPLVGAAVVTLTAWGLSPAATTPPRTTSPTINPRQAFSRRWHGSGTLVALHVKQGTGDLAEADGTLIPLRFSSRAQMQHMALGDELVISADAHAHSRLIVRSLSRRNLRSIGAGSSRRNLRVIGAQGARRNLRAIGVEGSRRNLRVRGVVARLLGHGQAEVLGVNGAAVIVDARTAHIVGSQYTTTGAGGALFAPSIAAAASLERPRPLALGEAIDTQVIWSHAKTMVVTTASVVATRVALIDVEGTVTRVNRAGGTMTLVDENGLSTVVHLGAAVKTYRVGQDAEASGAPAGNGQLQARAVEREAIPTTSAAPPRKTKDTPVSYTPATSTPTVTHAAAPVASNTPTSAAGAATATAPSTTPAPVVPIPGAPSSAPTTPTAMAAATSAPTPIAAIPKAPTTGVPTAMAAATFTVIPTATSTPRPPATSTAISTPRTPATSTATSTATPTATSTATSTPTSTDDGHGHGHGHDTTTTQPGGTPTQGS